MKLSLRSLLIALVLYSLPATALAQPTTIPCGAPFTDPGGPAGNYPDNADITYLACPGTPDEGVTATFSAFVMETGDKLTVYNGNSITAPVIGNYTGNLTASLPGGVTGIKATNISGCLTFRFTANASGNNTGWQANITCATQCKPVAGIQVSAISAVSASIAWLPAGHGFSPVSYSYEVRTSGAGGSGLTGLVASATVPATITGATLTGLTGNTVYQVYVRTNCGGLNTSQWLGPVSFTTLPACGTAFTDPGGPVANYGNNLDTTYVLCPAVPGTAAMVNFVTFETQPLQDQLSVYDGNSTAAPLIGSFSGLGLPAAPGGGSVVAANSTGCLTFRFTSNNATVYSGWLANVGCGVPPTCLAPGGFSIDSLSVASAILHWLAPAYGSPVSYAYEVRTDGLPGSGLAGLALSGIVPATTLSTSLAGLNANTVYYVYMRSHCSDGGVSDWSVQPLMLVTPPVCGSEFTDPGGNAANYPDNADVTYKVCANLPGEGVVVTFSAFNMGNGDKLSVYNGKSITAPLMANYAGNLTTNLPGGSAGLKSTDTSGCLTFRFTSNALVNGPGWLANVSCQPHCKPIENLNAVNIRPDSVTLQWANSPDGSVPAAYVYEIRLAGNPGSGPAGLVISGTAAAPAVAIAIGGLTGNTVYKAYLRVDCGGADTSQWRGPVSFTTLPGCGSTFNDPGGPLAAYGINLDTTYVLCPQILGEAVKVNFLSFETQLNFDKLFVYNGSSAAAPLIGAYSGIGLINAPGGGEVIANNPDGCLAFQFVSNASAVYAGWLANVSCVAPPVCVGPSGLQATNVSATGATLTWIAPLFSVPVNYEYEVRSNGLPGSGPAGLGASGSVPASSLTDAVSGLFPNTVYQVYTRGECGAGDYSAWSTQPLLLVTPPVCGNVFTDPGGAAGNYPDNADVPYKVCPPNPGEGVVVTFSQFNMASGDRLSVYNGSSLTSPLIGNYTGNLATNLPGGSAGIKSTDTTGCLTFRFVANAALNNTGWVANVSCAPHCLPVQGLAVNAITADGATLVWSNSPYGSIPAAYKYEIRTAGNPGGGAAGLVVSGNAAAPITMLPFSGLAGNTAYKAYVRVDCGGPDTSQWRGPVNFTTLPGCASTFTDPSGPLAVYANNLDTVNVLCPGIPGEVVQVNFVTFETQLNYDKLLVFNGNSTAAPFIGEYSGFGLPLSPGGGEVIADNPSGCLTFRFVSNVSSAYAGWLANVTCVPPPACAGPSGITFTNLTPVSANLQWTAPLFTTPAAYHYELRSSGLPGSGSAGLAAAGDLPAGTFNTEISGLAANTVYYVYMRSDCGSGSFSNWSALPLMLVTPPVCGSVFTDPGGVAGHYPDNSDVIYKVCPDLPGDGVTATFSQFNMASGDRLSVYNGSSITAPLLGNFSGNLSSSLPGGFAGLKATDTSGCLTFRFLSNTSLNNTGWVANITCAPHCKPATNLAISSITANSAQLSWSSPALGSAPAAYIYETRISGNPGSGPAGLAASGMVNVPATAATIPGLTGNTVYKVYLRTFCGPGDTSQWWAPLTFTTLPGCGSTFNDPGGPLYNYGNYQDSVTVLCPAVTGDAVQVNFLTFETQAVFDKLLVYDGPGITAPLLGTYSGSGLLNAPGAGEIIAANTAGCLTFRFVSNASLTYPGWLAQVACAPPPSCAGPTGIHVTGLTPTGAVLHWLPPMLTTPSLYEYEVRSSGMPGSGPAGLAASGASGAGSFSAPLSALPPNTVLYVYMRSECAPGDFSAWSANPLMLVTPPVCGSVFTDPGGVAGNYPDNANLTYVVCGGSAEDTVFVTFSAFNLSSGDVLSVYNGNSVAAPLIGNYSGNLATNLPGGLTGFMSDTATGCLTFRFASNAATNSSGWIASVNCHSPIPCTGTPSAGIAGASGPFLYCSSAPAKLLSLTGYTQGVPGITLHWQVSDDGITYTDIPGAGNATYTTPPSAATHYYRARVHCAASGMEDYSNPILIEVPGLPGVLTPPASMNICPGHSAMLTVAAANTAAYQWYKDGAAIPGATSDTLYFPAGSPADAGNYYVRLSGIPPCPNLNSSYATVTVNPISASISYGSDPYCSNAGTATPVHTGAGGGYYTSDAGLSIDSLTGVVDLAASAPGGHIVLYTIPAGGNCDTFFTTTGMFILDAPDIAVQPLPVTVCLSDPVSLSVLADGVAYYQWYKDGFQIPGANSATLSLPPATLADNGIYYVTLDGCTQSNNAAVTVVSEVVVDLGPDLTLCPGAGPILLDAGNPGAIYGWSTGVFTQSITAATPGTYVVTATIGSCWDTDILNIADGSLVSVSGIAVTDAAPVFTFSPEALTGASTFHWTFGDGSSATTEIASHTYTANGAYVVKLIVSNECGISDTAVTAVYVGGLTVPQTATEDVTLHVFPNPARTSVTIATGGAPMLYLELMDYTGRRLKTEAPGHARYVLPLADIAPGMYLIRVSTREGIATRKLEIRK